jgi:hypothetical protein
MVVEDLLQIWMAQFVALEVAEVAEVEEPLVPVVQQVMVVAQEEQM